ncbi:MAG: hypothetical protein A2675_02755 [Candidatus Yonathbacteria bacterium RIFCSPHIGHO2_01_FULL_51_10]|uniref:Uncharacterized protein n=1 Tax=Candidatus Yonathbacteria bacterium RIFCSPHIGHO2_01_FULL_51_10 TaxID=1802723 RepID=A0A1G2S695_9BACT|nr:MAG: hypothetical protein A2675_02755 [Candidatus Yonathbacteria bacterium RIFCSPHIGHO2_01_FULL_51_10]
MEGKPMKNQSPGAENLAKMHDILAGKLVDLPPSVLEEQPPKQVLTPPPSIAAAVAQKSEPKKWSNKGGTYAANTAEAEEDT